MSDTLNNRAANVTPNGGSLKNELIASETLFDKAYRVFFGEDVFISHSRIDGIAYARSLARLLQKNTAWPVTQIFIGLSQGKTCLSF